MKKSWIWLLSAALLFSCSSSPVQDESSGDQEAPVDQHSSGSQAPKQNSEQESSDGSYTYSVVAEELQIPWSIAISGKDIYISEREGQIVSLKDGHRERLPVDTKQPVKAQGEGGLLGLVLAPDFASSRLAYAYHTYEEGGEMKNRVILIRQEEEAWQEVEAFIEDIPGSNVHNGGRMKWGPDKKLYLTTGDAGEGEMAQNVESLGGKILRMNPDGSIPEDNPFPNSYVYSYGHRNSQGLAWDAAGRMFNSEHGPSGRVGGHDEINSIEPGSNYGWPDNIGDEQQEGMVPPLLHTGEEAIAPSGTLYEQEDMLLIAGLRGEALYRFDLEKKKLNTVLDGVGRIRDVQMSEDGVYLITNNTDGRGTPSPGDDRLLLLQPKQEQK
ncbi:PQQ-dependent sugar dehydrogenase [Paenibacillus sp. F411]|uniref:PQQ-dependent sugar dehydrogenase n=1 Tax=Paenibacillus sp. F411 TaxID=2820239 RepID=UPI001AAEECAF|nr:PQQ-dependent sugar dehydrogenase [Paenibacillus sp. F411]MBO2944269.1 PQQ-dependent sugar dehydrogenase [Paenibacillus sp. F411]